jgi:hypothetical protein
MITPAATTRGHRHPRPRHHLPCENFTAPTQLSEPLLESGEPATCC